MNEKWIQASKILAYIVDWVGDVFEHLSPAMFKMLSTVLPYLTPLPVAWLTAHSAAEFLGFTPEISVVFVVMLEGIGLWSTTELVDAFVEGVRSRTWKAWGVVAFLAAVVVTYVALLISLNVTLERAIGNVNPTYSFILTLICFLPVIAGSLNGYRKVKLEYKTELVIAKEKQDEKEAQIRAENNDFKLKRAMVKQGMNPLQQSYALDAPTVEKEVKEKHASDYREKAVEFIEKFYGQNHSRPTPKHLTERFGLDHARNKGYMSSLIKEVFDGHGWQ